MTKKIDRYMNKLICGHVVSLAPGAKKERKGSNEVIC